MAPLVRGLVQRGTSKSELNGVGAGVAWRADVSPFVTARLETGLERYWLGGDDTSGFFATTDWELRLDPLQRVDLGLGYHSLGDESEGNVLLRAAYRRGTEERNFRVGFDRTLRYDSYIALVGDKVGGIQIGSARENRFHGRLEAERGRADAGVELYGGWVEAESVSNNPFVGLRGRVDYTLLEADRSDLAAVLALDLYHYDEDAFGIIPSNSEPLPGGYFSPDFFFEQVIGLSASFHWGKDRYLDLEGGPALQWVDESSGSDFNIGGYGRLEFVMFLDESKYWTFEAGYTQISDAYTRFDGRTMLTFKF